MSCRGSSPYSKLGNVADGKYDLSVVDQQVGVIPLMGAIEGLGPEAGLEPKKADTDYAWKQFLQGSNVLKQGQDSMAVKALQVKLNALGYDLEADGDFGPGTHRAVKTFQAEYGLSIDGIVGPATGAKIDEIINGHDPDSPHDMAFWHPSKKNGIV